MMHDLRLFSKLPDDIICDILSRLSNGRLISRNARKHYQKRVKSIIIKPPYGDVFDDILNVNDYTELEHLSVSLCDVGGVDLSTANKLRVLHVIDCVRVYQLQLPSHSTSLVHLNLTCMPYLSQLKVNGFPNLAYLECRDSRIKTLDLSINTKLLSVVICDSRQLEQMKLPALHQLNKLASLNINHCLLLEGIDVRGCTNLRELICNHCHELKSINGLEQCMELRVLEADDCGELNLPPNMFTSMHRITRIQCQAVASLYHIDVINAHYLRKLRIDTTGVNAISVSQCPYLEELDISGTSVDSIDLSNNKRLKKLWCDGCELQSLDLHNNTKLEMINCAFNANLDVINLPSICPHLRYVYCNHTSIEDLDWESLTSVQELYLATTHITFIYTAIMPYLKYLDCSDTPVDFLDLDYCPNLQTLICRETLISTLDITRNIRLRYLNCASTDISELNLSHAILLVELQLQNTQIGQLDIVNLRHLRFLDCSGTLVKALDIRANKQIRMCKVDPSVVVMTSTPVQEGCIVRAEN